MVTILHYITSLISTDKISWMYEFLKDELARRNVLIDFDKDDDPNNTIFLNEYQGFTIKCQTYENDPAVVDYWSVFQEGECLISVADRDCSVLEAQMTAKKWLNIYISRKRYILQEYSLKCVLERNAFLYFYKTFEVLCVVSPKRPNLVSWSAYYRNARIMGSKEKYDTVIRAQRVAYWEIDKYLTINKEE